MFAQHLSSVLCCQVLMTDKVVHAGEQPLSSWRWSVPESLEEGAMDVLIWRDSDGDEYAFCSIKCLQEHVVEEVETVERLKAQWEREWEDIPEAKPVRVLAKGEPLPPANEPLGVCYNCLESLEEEGEEEEAIIGNDMEGLASRERETVSGVQGVTGGQRLVEGAGTPSPGVGEAAASTVAVITALIATVTFTVLGFIWIWSIGGLGAAILAAIFLWWIPATVGYWVGLAVVLPFLVALGVFRGARGAKG